MATEHISIRNLDKYQHYKDRNIVWIKWHLDCYQDYNFNTLEPAEKWFFIGLIGLACKSGNKIPKDGEHLSRLLGGNPKTILLAIDKMLASKLLAVCYTHKIREDKIREDKIREDKSAGNPTKTKFGEFVFLTAEEHQKLLKQFGETGTTTRIEKLNNYLGSTGKKYKSHYYTILNWERNNGGIKNAGFRKPTVERGAASNTYGEFARPEAKQHDFTADERAGLDRVPELQK